MAPRGRIDENRPLRNRVTHRGWLYLTTTALALSMAGAGWFALRHKEPAVISPLAHVHSDSGSLTVGRTVSVHNSRALLELGQIRVLGVVAPNQSGREGLAEIDVNGRGPVLFRLGQLIEPGIALAEIHQRYIIVDAEGNRGAIEIEDGSPTQSSRAGSAATQGVLAGAAAGGYGSAAPALPGSSQSTQSVATGKLSPGSEAFVRAIRALSDKSNGAGK